MKINRTSPQSNKYLQIIDTIAKSPKWLYFMGLLPPERIASVAIVGSRKPTAYGREVTYQIAYALAKSGVVIISGLAVGIDAIAHQAAIDAGGVTLAILPSGLDQIYPSSNQKLAKDILSRGGAIISEYDIGISARNYQFLERNRIVSGLADAVIVTEAAIRSGTLSTAAHALSQGREVMVVPGNITSPMSAGCNNLIKQGAHPITCPDDVLEIIAPELLRPQTALALGDTPLESRIISLLQSGIRDGDALQETTQAPASEFTQALTMLEINGLIRSLGGNQWTIR